MAKNWQRTEVLDFARAFQPVCVLAAAAELELFGALARRPLTAAQTAKKLAGDPRAVTILLDALAALRLLVKRGGRYALAAGVAGTLTAGGKQSVLAITQHQANCLRRWAQLAGVIKSGRPARCAPSIRGTAGDIAAFVGGMDDLSAPVADEVVACLKKMPFRHVLDLGGASGTWTLALLRHRPRATATLFDLPAVLPLARRRLRAAGMLPRVRLAGGDFMRDALPAGADLAWVSAIIHQNSRAENRQLFGKLFHALAPGGWVAIRDIVMAPGRVAPLSGALFAVNMLVGTRGGGTYTFAEIRADLRAAGFTAARMLRREPTMNGVVAARKPA
jgi:hypothetical protein